MGHLNATSARYLYLHLAYRTVLKHSRTPFLIDRVNL
jgi:hypothetical protein